MTEDEVGAGPTKKKEGIREGMRQGLGFLSALKDAIEDTIAEARDRGDLSPDRAREALKGALGRAQEAADDARGRLDFATRRELEELTRVVEGLKARLDRLDGGEPSRGGEAASDGASGVRESSSAEADDAAPADLSGEDAGDPS